MSVEAEKLGVKDDDSLAHWIGEAATPNASLADGDGDQSLELELQEEHMPPPELLSDGLSLEEEDVVWSNRLPRNSRIPMIHSPERLGMPRLFARACVYYNAEAEPSRPRLHITMVRPAAAAHAARLREANAHWSGKIPSGDSLPRDSASEHCDDCADRCL